MELIDRCSGLLGRHRPLKVREGAKEESKGEGRRMNAEGGKKRIERCLSAFIRVYLSTCGAVEL